MKRLAAVLASLLMTAPAWIGAQPAGAESYVPVTGAGSTWSQVAVDAWRADVRANGIVVNFSGTGSTDGRIQYIQKTVDFANSEIPFQDPAEPGQPPERPDRPYAYLPIVAGGTAFMYHLTVGGKQVRNLRLSGETLTKMYTGAIARWSDAQITRENGFALPDIPIIPVVRSDGAGASAQFTRYMARQYPSLWCPFAQKRLGQPANQCGLTSFYPSFGNSKAQVGSNGVANYVAASYGEGSIGYVEYAYAKRLNYPVVNLLNQAGYYIGPSAGNVAVALTKAQINTDLTQNLDAVYVNPDRRTYPLSSYSYMIAPTTTKSPMTADKGKSLSTFINYFLCAGQQKADILGYSPLPENLVLAGFAQVRRIPGFVEPPALKSCNNPALRILQTAPFPADCLKATNVNCGVAPITRAPTGGGTGNGGGSTGGGTTGGGSGAGTGSTSGSGSTATNGSSSSGSGANVASRANAAGGETIDPITGEVISGQTDGEVVAGALPVSQVLASGLTDDTTKTVLYILSGLALLAAAVVPPIIVTRRRRPS